ncbi:unnamed protein product, partial [Aphanomyces euteiches]
MTQSHTRHEKAQKSTNNNGMESSKGGGTYASYQRQFEEFCKHEKDGIDPASATAEICTDYFHHLFSLGRKARTVDTAKTALVAYFKDHKIDPNPAQETTSK